MARRAAQVSHKVKSKIKSYSGKELVWQVADHRGFDASAQASEDYVYNLQIASVNG